jgi:predicted DNA-binding protein (MmcQ/YjbR family)
MTADELRAACLALPGATEDMPFVQVAPDLTTFKVGGKVFALSRLTVDPLTVSLKCEPDIAVALREEHAAIRPGHHLDKRLWNTVLLDGSLPDRLVREMVEDSYDLVVAKLPRRARP